MQTRLKQHPCSGSSPSFVEHWLVHSAFEQRRWVCGVKLSPHWPAGAGAGQLSGAVAGVCALVRLIPARPGELGVGSVWTCGLGGALTDFVEMMR